MLFRNVPRRRPFPVKKAALPAVLTVLLLFCYDAAPLHAREEPERGADTLLGEALEAQMHEHWELSIELLSRGTEQYPGDYRFPWALGSLYYSRKLYGLAWEEYRKAEPDMPLEPEMLFRLSRASGFLNLDTVSAAYLERVLELEPGNKEAIDSLAWMYYKLHRLSDGAELLHNAVETLGSQRDFCMTLGTIYSAMFRYDDAKNWYLKAISAAEQAGDMNFATVTHYNLSILESRYYNYADAFERTNASLAARSGSARESRYYNYAGAVERTNASLGRLARGEIYLRRLDLARTFQDYQSAYETDTSPLAKMNLAMAYQIAGRLEESRLYAEDCLNTRDLSWMLNYGTDTDRYRRDIHEILYKTYGGLFHTEAFKVYPGVSAELRGFFQKWYYRFKEAYHKILFKKYSLAAARAYSAERSDSDSVFYGAAGLDAQTEYYNALESYPRRALTYLRNARGFEVPLIPPAAPTYDAEEGTLMKNPALLRRAGDGFDPVWERDMIAESLAELCRALRGRRRRAERQDAAERLYALNKAALLQNGIALPVEIIVDADLWKSPASTDATSTGATPTGATSRQAARIVKKTLTRMGFQEAAPGAGARFLLIIVLSGDTARCELQDRGRGTTPLRESIPLPSLSRQDLSAFAAHFETAAFTGF
jgi:tetratricopeptide (TPR) repeat protein